MTAITKCLIERPFVKSVTAASKAFDYVWPHQRADGPLWLWREDHEQDYYTQHGGPRSDSGARTIARAKRGRTRAGHGRARLSDHERARQCHYFKRGTMIVVVFLHRISQLAGCERRTPRRSPRSPGVFEPLEAMSGRKMDHMGTDVLPI